jgi:type II secretory pathway pseudopilin PulG
MAGEVASTQAQRERELELLFIGHQYRDAIERYYRQNHRFPTALADLVQNTTDGPGIEHYIRRLYRDPMTRALDWTLVPAPVGGFMGVASASQRPTLKRAGFEPVDTDFDKAETYSDWTFVFDPLLKFRGAIPAPKVN